MVAAQGDTGIPACALPTVKNACATLRHLLCCCGNAGPLRRRWKENDFQESFPAGYAFAKAIFFLPDKNGHTPHYCSLFASKFGFLRGIAWGRLRSAGRASAAEQTPSRGAISRPLGHGNRGGIPPASL